MMVCHNLKAVFHHVMKTAGTSLTTMLQSGNYNWEWLMGMHGKYSDLYKSNNDDYNIIKNYYNFTFVRNPWSHAVSFYFHKTDKKRYNFITKININNKPITDEEYKDFNFFLNYIYVPQSNVTIDDPYFLNNDFFYYENFENESKKILKKFNYSEINIKKINATPRYNIFNMEYPSDYKSMFDQKGKDIIFKRCKSYIDKFNYSF